MADMYKDISDIKLLADVENVGNLFLFMSYYQSQNVYGVMVKTRIALVDGRFIVKTIAMLQLASPGVTRTPPLATPLVVRSWKFIGRVLAAAKEGKIARAAFVYQWR